jgi:hypothetical protein
VLDFDPFSDHGRSGATFSEPVASVPRWMLVSRVVMSKACIIRALRSDPHYHLMHWTLGAIIVSHVLAPYIRHSHAKLNLLANIDVAYLMRAGSLGYMRIYPTLFFPTSFVLYFALSAEFVPYQWAPK